MLGVFLVLLVALVVHPVISAAQDQPVNVYLFWTRGCPHCAQEKDFLPSWPAGSAPQGDHLRADRVPGAPGIIQAGRRGAPGRRLRVPFTVVGRQFIIGWLDEATTGAALEQAVAAARRTNAPDVVAGLRAGPRGEAAPPLAQPLPEKLHLPFFGEIEIKYLSLGLVTVIIGLLDGFNPCAMWVLVFLINLLLGMEDRRRMWILGGTFIFSSGLVYFLFMTAWLNFLILVGFIVWVRIAIGLVALLPPFTTCGNISPTGSGSVN